MLQKPPMEQWVLQGDRAVYLPLYLISRLHVVWDMFF